MQNVKNNYKRRLWNEKKKMQMKEHERDKENKKHENE